MPERKSLSKKTRFEVFKRDKFTCQYCGKQAPDVVLHVDHVVPVAKGGENDIFNLVTSCSDCNLGKSDRELNDDSVVSKQRKQIEMVAERHKQIEMMVEWKKTLIDTVEKEAAAANDYLNSVTGFFLEDGHARSVFSPLIKKYGLTEVLEGIDAACDSYLRNRSQREAVMIVDKLPGVLFVRSKGKSDPIYALAQKVAGACKKHKYGSGEESAVRDFVTRCRNVGITEEHVWQLYKKCSYVGDFVDLCERAIKGLS